MSLPPSSSVTVTAMSKMPAEVYWWVAPTGEVAAAAGLTTPSPQSTVIVWVSLTPGSVKVPVKVTSVFTWLGATGQLVSVRLGATLVTVTSVLSVSVSPLSSVTCSVTASTPSSRPA